MTDLHAALFLALGDHFVEQTHVRGAVDFSARDAVDIGAYRMFQIAHGKRQRASYTWRMVNERGIIPAVEHAVTRPKETAGYRGLQAEGMLDMAFEAVVLRHKDLFSADAVKKSEERLARWRAGGGD